VDDNLHPGAELFNTGAFAYAFTRIFLK